MTRLVLVPPVPPTLALPPVPDPKMSMAPIAHTASSAQMNFLVIVLDRTRRLATVRSRRPAVGRPFGGVVAGMGATVGQVTVTTRVIWGRTDGIRCADGGFPTSWNDMT